MSARRVEVEINAVIVMDFDDEAVSDWDGRTLLTRNENPEAYLPGTTPDDVLAGAAITIGLWNSRDGFADFPNEAIRASIYEYPEVVGVILRDDADLRRIQ